MRVLVSNDDGVDAPGIRILAAQLRAAGHEVWVVAPDRDRSGARNSLTLDQPIRVAQVDDATWRVYGTPTDCVHVALGGLLEHEPDIVVSGINSSANLGDDADTTAAITGQIAGACFGIEGIPEHWRRRLAMRDEIEEMARRLGAAGSTTIAGAS